MIDGSNGLPPGWADATLGDLTVRKVEQAEPQGETFRYIDIGSLDRERKSICQLDEQPSATAPSRARQVVRAGDVLVSMTRPNLNAVAAVPMHLDGATASTGFDVLRPVLVEPGWLLAHVRTRHFVEEMATLVQGALYPAVNSSDVRGSRIPVPPLAEQKRIVAKIEALQEEADAVKDALDAIPTLLEKFRRSVLASAFRGDLTTAWREQHPDVEPASKLLERIRAERRRRWEEANPRKKYAEPEPPDTSNGTPSLPESWAVVSVAEVTECLDRIRKPVTRKDRRPGPYPYYGANGQVDSVADYLFDDELVLVTEDETFYGRTKPIAYRVSGKCWVNNHAHVLKAAHPVPPDYLCQSLMHYDVRPWLSGTTGRAKLTQGALSVLPIALAPAEEMVIVAAKVRELLDFADSVQQAVAALGSPLALLHQSILAKAFRGELVSQDPDDEPARILLGRIRAEREGNGVPPGRAHGRGRRVEANAGGD